MHIDPPRLVASAFLAVRAEPDAQKERIGGDHRDRSSRFVEHLGKQLRIECSGAERVLTRGFVGNKQEFGLNELLWDILVCEVESVSSARNGATLSRITKGVLAVESELAEDSREALYDFNKLLLADCETKLFIASQTASDHEFMRILEPPKHGRASFYLALLPHPRSWKQATVPLEKHFRWSGMAWKTI